MSEIEAAKAYQAELMLALATARVRLSASDFLVASVGLEAEIHRLDLAINALRLRSMMGCEDVPLFPRIFRFANIVAATLQVPEPNSFANRPEMASVVSDIRISASGATIYPPARIAAFSGQRTVCV